MPRHRAVAIDWLPSIAPSARGTALRTRRSAVSNALHLSTPTRRGRSRAGRLTASSAAAITSLGRPLEMAPLMRAWSPGRAAAVRQTRGVGLPGRGSANRWRWRHRRGSRVDGSDAAAAVAYPPAGFVADGGFARRSWPPRPPARCCAVAVIDQRRAESARRLRPPRSGGPRR